jgi:hypothetical protein
MAKYDPKNELGRSGFREGKGGHLMRQLTQSEFSMEAPRARADRKAADSSYFLSHL